MRNRFLCLCLLVLLVAGCSGVEDTSPEPTPLADYEREARLDELWIGSTGDAFNQKWTRLFPVAAEDALYTVNIAGQVTAWERDSGRKKWRSETGQWVSAGVGLGPDNVYVGTPDGKMVAFRRSDGERLWSHSVGGELVAAPAAGRDVVVARTVDGRVTAVEPGSGERRWTFSYTVPSLSLRGAGTPLVVPGGVIVGLDDGRVVALNGETGEMVWETRISEPEGPTPIERMVDIDGTLGVGRNRLYASAFQGRLVEIDPSQGRIGWSRTIPSYVGANADGERLYVTDQDGRVHALDQTSGRSAWTQEALAYRGVSAPVPVPGTDWLAVTDRENYVHLLARDDGRVVARTRIPGRWGILSDPAVDPDGNIFVQGRGARIIAFEPRALD